MPKPIPLKEKDVNKEIRRPRPHAGLTKTQEQLAELASDLILEGGDRADVEGLLLALLSHQHRRMVSPLRTDRSAEQKERDTASWALSFLERTYRALAVNWPTEPEKKPDSEKASRKSAADVTRADIRRRLRDEFDDFMRDMEGVENAYILKEILENVNSCGGDIATEFSRFVTEGDDIYVRVPWGLKDKVVQVVKLLKREAA